MAPYDSDSSGDEEDYTETNVLLGYASKEPTGDTVSQLGGYPTWLDDQTTPSFALAKCKVCNDPMTLLLQLNSNLPEHFPSHERRLYIFSCRRKTCRRKEGCARGLRATRVSKAVADAEKKKKEATKAAEAEAALKKQEEQKKPQTNLGDALFGVSTPTASASANPFSTSSSSAGAPANPFSTSSGTANPFSAASDSLAAKPAQPPSSTSNTLPETFAQKVRISSPPTDPAVPRPHEPWPPQSSFPPPFPPYHLDADYETLSSEKPNIPQNARLDPDAAEPSSSGGGAGGKEDKEAFESMMDKTFQRFADRLAQNSEQVLRYEWRGSPLLYSKDDKVGRMLAPHHPDENAKVKASAGGAGGMPRCGNCGAERVFELQLTPQAIAELEAEELGLEGMEWGTIIMGVCSMDCMARDVKEGEVGYLEEWVGVQWEEVAERKR